MKTSTEILKFAHHSGIFPAMKLDYQTVFTAVAEPPPFSKKEGF
jgi:hypothetical protein